MIGIKGKGFNTLALQADIQADGRNNEKYAFRVRDCCDQLQVIYGIWESIPVPEKDNVASYGARFYIAESERSVDWVSITDTFRANYPTMPAATVTNFNLTDADIQALHDADFDCLGESYVPENPQATPEAQSFEASRRGWLGHRFQPVVEVNASNPLDAAIASAKNFRNYWVWSAEYVL